jgi:hypothetical protein
MATEHWIEDPEVCYWCPEKRPTVYVDILGFPWCKQCYEYEFFAHKEIDE